MKKHTALVDKLEKLPKITFILICLLIFSTFFILGIMMGKLVTKIRFEYIVNQQIKNEETLKQQLIKKIQFQKRLTPTININKAK